MTRPDQYEIAAWADGAFGPAPSLLRSAARVSEEAIELLTAVTSSAPDPDIAEECADVFICAARLAVLLGAQLDTELTLRPTTVVSLREVGAVTIACLSTQVALVLAVRSTNPKERAAQVLAGLCAAVRDLCVAVGADFDAEVAAKMIKNRARRWVLDGTGCGRHAKTEGA